MSSEIGTATWKKQEFILETGEKYVKLINISVWGDNLMWLERCQVDDFVNVMINISSKKVNERWFTEIAAWRIDIDMIRMKQYKEMNQL